MKPHQLANRTLDPLASYDPGCSSRADAVIDVLLLTPQAHERDQQTDRQTHTHTHRQTTLFCL